MSREGISPCEPEVHKNLAIICSFVCFCNQNPSLTKDGSNPTPVADGAAAERDRPQYKQACVDYSLTAYNAISSNDSKILVEPPFYVPKDTNKVPISLLSADIFDIESPPLGRSIAASRLAKSEMSQDVIDSYIKRELAIQSLRDSGLKVAPYARGELSIPDTVIVKDRNSDATPDNIQAVGEIKFPPDEWDDRQYACAVRIAGGLDIEVGKNKVQTLTPDSCKCDGERQRVDENAGQPAQSQNGSRNEDALSRLSKGLAAPGKPIGFPPTPGTGPAPGTGPVPIFP